MTFWHRSSIYIALTMHYDFIGPSLVGSRRLEIVVMSLRLTLLLIVGLAFLTSQVSAQTAAGYQRAAKLLLDAIDETKNPCENFYDFACRKWVASNPLQPGVERRSAFHDVANDVETETTGKRIPFFWSRWRTEAVLC